MRAANVAQSITGGNSRGAARLTVVFVSLLLVYEGSANGIQNLKLSGPNVAFRSSVLVGMVM